MKARPNHRIAQRLSPAVTFFVLAVFLVRALVPTGWMPALGLMSGAGTSIVLCTAHGNSTITLDQQGKPIAPQSDEQQCPFASAAAAAIPPPAPAVIPLPHSVRDLQAPVTSAARAIDRSIRPPARGPPLSA